MPFLSFIVPIFPWNVPLVSLIFLTRCLVFPILLFSLISLHWLLRKAFLSLLAILWNSAFRCVYWNYSLLNIYYLQAFFHVLPRHQLTPLKPLGSKTITPRGTAVLCSDNRSQSIERWRNSPLLTEIRKGEVRMQFWAVGTSLVTQTVKRPPKMWETQVHSLGWEDLLEKEITTHSSILAWKIPWMEEPGRLQSMRLQKVRHDWATSLSFFSFWAEKCEPEQLDPSYEASK